MSRRRDTNWSRDEITVLLDSIAEITRMRAEDGKRTNSREVFEFAAKKMGEKGHASRAEREKCRTKWKKMKEEFANAKRAREGDSRFKEAPGIQPFYERMEKFIRGTFDNISPHSTIVRRTSSLSSSSGGGNATPTNTRNSFGMRVSARIAANCNGASSNDPKDGSSVIPRTTATASYQSTTVPTSSNASPSMRQNSSRLSSSSNSTNYGSMIIENADNNVIPRPSNHPIAANSSATSNETGDTVEPTNSGPQMTNLHSSNSTSSPLSQSKAIANGDMCTVYASNVNNNSTAHSNISAGSEHMALGIGTSNHYNNLQSLTGPAPVPLANEHADISYRVSTGCRQITIFGDHDVDIKFRGDCVTINKISTDYAATTEI